MIGTVRWEVKRASGNEHAGRAVGASDVINPPKDTLKSLKNRREVVVYVRVIM